MKQIGTVIEIDGEIAKIECDRQSACDMCENASGCKEKCKKVYATALNRANAKVGDIVEIETNTGKVLKSAIFVFLFPIIFAVIAYIVSNRFFGEGIAAVCTLAALVFSAMIFSFVLDRKAKRDIPSVVVKILA